MKKIIVVVNLCLWFFEVSFLSFLVSKIGRLKLNNVFGGRSNYLFVSFFMHQFSCRYDFDVAYFRDDVWWCPIFDDDVRECASQMVRWWLVWLMWWPCLAWFDHLHQLVSPPPAPPQSSAHHLPPYKTPAGLFDRCTHNQSSIIIISDQHHHQHLCSSF